MKFLATAFLFLLSSQAMSATFTGAVRKFSGVTVESRRPYSYVAFQTDKGLRLRLPSWVKAEALVKIPHQITVVGDVDALMCTDMSAACMTGVLTNVKSFQIGIGKRLTDAEKFEGKLVEFKGFGVTIRKPYRYLAVDAQNARVSLPSFLNAEELLKSEVNADYTLLGKVTSKACIDMSSACGALEVSPLSSLRIKF